MRCSPQSVKTLLRKEPKAAHVPCFRAFMAARPGAMSHAPSTVHFEHFPSRKLTNNASPPISSSGPYNRQPRDRRLYGHPPYDAIVHHEHSKQRPAFVLRSAAATLDVADARLGPSIISHDCIVAFPADHRGNLKQLPPPPPAPLLFDYSTCTVRRASACTCALRYAIQPGHAMPS